MSDQSRILLAVGALVLGLALSAGGTYLLGSVRAVARHSGAERRRRADAGQYVAAFGALAGFVLVAGGAALIVSELMPASDAVRLVGAAVAGVLAFAAAGVAFSRVADSAENARVRRMPPPPYVPTPPSPPPALPPGLTVPSAPPARAVTVPPGATTPRNEEAILAPPPSEVPQAGAERDAAAPVAPLRGPRALDAGSAGIEQALAAGPGASDESAGETAAAAPIELEQVADADSLVAGVRPGWIYRDEADGWYLGVGNGGTDGPLLRLPEFGRVRADEPAYPLLIVGAGEIAVVPVPAVGPVDSDTPTEPS